VIAQAIHSPGYAQLYVAEARGLFQEEGLQVEFLRGGGGAKATMLLLTGEAQFSVKSAEVVSQSRQPDVSLIAVQAITVGLPFQLIIRSDSLRERAILRDDATLERLKKVRGLTFATTTRGGASALYTRYLLSVFGLDPETHLEVAYLNDPQSRKVAFQTGQAQLTTAGTENSSYLESGQAAVLVDLLTDVPALQKIPFLSLNTLTHFAQQSPDTVRKVTRVLAKSNDFIREHPDLSLQILEREFKDRFKPQALAKIFDQQVLPTLPRQKHMTKAQWTSLVEIAAASGMLETNLDTNEGSLWTNQFLDP